VSQNKTRFQASRYHLVNNCPILIIFGAQFPGMLTHFDIRR